MEADSVEFLVAEGAVEGFEGCAKGARGGEAVLLGVVVREVFEKYLLDFGHLEVPDAGGEDALPGSAAGTVPAAQRRGLLPGDDGLGEDFLEEQKSHGGTLR